jgi:hypothetical protein
VFTDTIQNIYSIEANTELQKTYEKKYENANNEMTKAQDDLDSVLGTLTNIENIFSVRCYDWFKIKTETPSISR